MNKIVKGILHNSIGEVGSRLPLIVTELLIAKSLGLASYGIWAMIQLLISYNNFSHFGLLSGLAKLEPIALGEEQSSRYINKLHANAFYPVLLLDIFILIPILYLLIEVFNYSYLLVISLIILGVLQQIFLYFQTRIQNALHFKLLSVAKLSYSFIFMLLAISALLSLEIEVYQLVICWCLAYFFVISYLGFVKRLIPKFSFDIYIMKDLLACGFPIFVLGILKLGIISADRFMIGVYYSNEDLAIYNISFQAMVISSMVLGLISRVFAPHFLRISKDEYAKNILYETIKTNSFRFTVIIVQIILFVFVILIEFYLSEYRSGLLVGVVSIYTGLYQGLNQFVITRLISSNKEKVLFYVYFLMSFVYIVVICTLILNGASLLSISIFSFAFWFIVEVSFSICLKVESFTSVIKNNLFSVASMLVCFYFVMSQYYTLYFVFTIVCLGGFSFHYWKTPLRILENK